MLGEKKRFYILDQQISENRAWGGGGGGWVCVLGKVKVRFKVLHFTDTNISITLSASL